MKSATRSPNRKTDRTSFARLATKRTNNAIKYILSAWQGWEDCWNFRAPKPVSLTQCKQAATNAHNKGDLAWDSDTVTKAVLDAAGVKYVD